MRARRTSRSASLMAVHSMPSSSVTSPAQSWPRISPAARRRATADGRCALPEPGEETPCPKGSNGVLTKGHLVQGRPVWQTRRASRCSGRLPTPPALGGGPSRRGCVTTPGELGRRPAVALGLDAARPSLAPSTAQECHQGLERRTRSPGRHARPTRVAVNPQNSIGPPGRQRALR